MSTTTTAPEAASTDALGLWLDLVEDKLKGDYDSGELHRLVVDCDIDPRLTSDSARAFAALVQAVVPSGQLAILILSNYFVGVDLAGGYQVNLAVLRDRLDEPAAREMHEYLDGDEGSVAKARKERAESIKACGVDSVANVILSELGHLSPQDRHDRIDAILTELRRRITA